jgi:hypothetical protein
VTRRLAELAAAAVGGVVGHVGTRWVLTRDWSRADEDDVFSETQAQQFERRLAAIEAHLSHLPPERVM